MTTPLPPDPVESKYLSATRAFAVLGLLGALLGFYVARQIHTKDPDNITAFAVCLALAALGAVAGVGSRTFPRFAATVLCLWMVCGFAWSVLHQDVGGWAVMGLMSAASVLGATHVFRRCARQTAPVA